MGGGRGAPPPRIRRREHYAGRPSLDAMATQKKRFLQRISPPIRNETGAVAGNLCIAFETTKAVREKAERGLASRGKKSGSGRGKPEDHSPSRMGAPAAKLQPAGPPQSVPRPQRRPLALVRNTPHKSNPFGGFFLRIGGTALYLPPPARCFLSLAIRSLSRFLLRTCSAVLPRSSIGTYASTVAKRRRAS
jgi:hypothetical protein